jgi:hypothetical protein
LFDLRLLCPETGVPATLFYVRNAKYTLENANNALELKKNSLESVKLTLENAENVLENAEFKVEIGAFALENVQNALEIAEFTLEIANYKSEFVVSQGKIAALCVLVRTNKKRPIGIVDEQRHPVGANDTRFISERSPDTAIGFWIQMAEQSRAPDRPWQKDAPEGFFLGIKQHVGFLDELCALVTGS